MKTFNTVEEYSQVAKIGDIIALQGYGILDGIKSIKSKHDIHKIHKIKSDNTLVFREYRGRTNFVLGASSLDQKIAVLTKQEFKELPILY